MLTLEEVLADVVASPGFESVEHVNIHSRGAQGQTALHWMATLGDVQGLRLLLNAGGLMNAQDNLGNMPLHEAVYSRQEPAARVLLLLGASPEQQNFAGQSPRQAAEAEGYEPLIKLLCKSVP